MTFIIRDQHSSVKPFTPLHAAGRSWQPRWVAAVHGRGVAVVGWSGGVRGAHGASEERFERSLAHMCWVAW